MEIGGQRRDLGDLRVALLVDVAVLAWSGRVSMGTQGVALGWYVTPRWGWEWRLVVRPGHSDARMRGVTFGKSQGLSAEVTSTAWGVS